MIAQTNIITTTNKMTNIDLVENEIFEHQKDVAYNTVQYPIDVLVAKFGKGNEEDAEIYIPEYQREFTWDIERQSKFIESIILGLPIPFIFVAEVKENNNRLEIVDGSQRIRTLWAFLNNKLQLIGLETLKNLNGFMYSDLHEARQRKFRNTPIRMVVLTDKANEQVRNDMFERINRGSDLLKDMEKRKGIYMGVFCDFIYKICAENLIFKKLTPLNKFMENRQEHEELILRFFALADNYKTFPKRQGIAKYLDEYLETQNLLFTDLYKSEEYKNSPMNILMKNPKLITYFNKFENMLNFVDTNFQHGFAKTNAPQVSRIYFEALSVGSYLAIEAKPELLHQDCKLKIPQWINSKEFKEILSGKYHTHIPERIIKRIEFVRDNLLGVYAKS